MINIACKFEGSYELLAADLKNRTYSLLCLFEDQPLKTFQLKTNDLLKQVESFSVLFDSYPICLSRYLEHLNTCLNPQPLEGLETAHDFVKRHIFDAIGEIDFISKKYKNRG